MEIVTFVIAIAGFLLSLTSWIKDFVTQRVRLDVQITTAGRNEALSAIFCYFAIANRSRLPISITNIELSQPGTQIACVPVPKLVFEGLRKEGSYVVERRPEYSTAMPVQIQSLGGVTVLAQFEHLPEKIPADATSLNLVICTNRGRPKRMTLPLPKDWDDPRNIL